ncbi:MAG: HlyD family efflux transporter periplasmic adaptor subunit, partial [Pseudomonadota bacterium]
QRLRGQAFLHLRLMQRDLRPRQVRAVIQANILARQQDLRRRRVVTDSTVERATLDSSSAEQAVLAREQALADASSREARAAVALDRARLALEDARRALAETEVRAPFAGMLAETTAVLGRQVNAGEKLGVLIDPAEFEAAAPVSNAEYARLLDDQGALPERLATVTLDLGAREAVFEARLARAGAGSADAKTGRKLYARLDAAAAEALREGDFVTLRIAEPELDGVARLPATALTEDGRVLIVGRGDRLAERELTILRRMGNEVIVGDAPFGRDLVLQRRPELGAGVKVRPVPAEAAEAGEAMAAAPTRQTLVSLSPERRAALSALVQSTGRMPAERKAAALEALAAPEVPRRLVDRLERIEAALSRSGG